MAAENTDIIEGEIVEESSDSSQPDSKTSAHNASRKGQSEKSQSRFGWIVASILFAFIGGAVTFPYMQLMLQQVGLVPNPVHEASVSISESVLESRLDTVDATLVRYREMLAQHAQQLEKISIGTSATKVPAGQLNAVQKRLVDMTQRLQLLEAGVQNQAPSDVVQPLSVNGPTLQDEVSVLRAQLLQLQNAQKDLAAEYADRLAGLESGALSGTPRGRLYLALLTVRDKALSGTSVVHDIAELIKDERFLEQAEAVTALEQLRGWLLDNSAEVQSLRQLTLAFDSVARDFARARQKEKGGLFASLFTLRQTGADADGDDALLVQVEQRLNAGDIVGAAAAAKALEAVPGDTLSVWIASAEHHSAVAEKFEKLITHVRGAVF